MITYGSLPFAEAIAYLKTKVPQATEHWDDIEGAAHDHTFIVAGAAKADLLTALHQAVLKGIEQDTTLEEFRRDFDAIVGKHGWTGWTGEGTDEGRAWRTKVIYGTNLRTAYQAGRLSQARAIQAERPYWRYRHNDTVQHPRPQHQAWNGKVLPADDPWWGTHYPPNGWGCRCYIETLAPRDLAREGITVDPAPDDGTYEHVDRNGEPHTLPKGIDYGWDHQPGSTRDLVAEVQRRAGKMPPQIGKDLMAAIDRPPARAAGQTGAGTDADRVAEVAYARIRASTTDVAAIAQATGIKPANIQKVKNHTFMQEHLLDRFVSLGIAARRARFQASPPIAAAWERLAAGLGRPDDLQLLRHEAAEAWFMRRHGPSYDAAHTAAQARYPWQEE